MSQPLFNWLNTIREENDMNISELKESKYLAKHDCEPPITVTVRGLSRENLAMEGKEPDFKYILHFAEEIKPMVLNQTNGKLIAYVLKSDETDNWKGKMITLWNDPTVSFGSEMTGGIRVKVEPSTAAPALQGEAAPTQPVDDMADIEF